MTVKEAMSSPEGQRQTDAMEKEMKSIEANEVWGVSQTTKG